MRPRLFTVLLAIVMAVMLAGCGGGSGGSGGAPGNNGGSKLLYTTSNTIGISGGTITAPAPYNVTVTIPANSVTADTPVVLSVYDTTALPVQNSDVTAISNVVKVDIPSDNLQTGAQISVTAECDKPTEGYHQCVALSDGAGTTVAVDSSIEAGTGSYTALISKAQLDNLVSRRAQKAKSRSFASIGSLYIGAKQWITRNYPASGKLLRLSLSIGGSPTQYLNPEDLQSSNKFWSDLDATPLDSASDGKHIALVIHGINNSINDMTPLAYYLLTLKDQYGKPKYNEVWGFDYAFRASITDNGKILSDAVNGLLQNTKMKLDVYAHSQGGLVSRWAIEKNKMSPHVTRLFTLDTPHGGVPATVLETYGFGAVPALNGYGITDMSQGGRFTSASTFLADLNDPTVGARDQDNHMSVEYITFAGNRWKDYKSAWFPTGTTAQKLFSGDEENNDGIVPVSSSQLNGQDVLKTHFASLDIKAKWTHPSERYCLAHDMVRGVYSGGTMTANGYVGGQFNLDNAQPSDDTVDAQYRTSAHRRLRDYILNTGIGQIGVN